MYLVFYSKNCRFSHKFVKVLAKLPNVSHFDFVTVDKVNGKRSDLVKEYNVTEVPTIIVNQRYYIGKEAFSWLDSEIRNLNNAVQTENTRNNKTKLTKSAGAPMLMGFSPSGNFCDVSGAGIDNGGDSNSCSLMSYQTIQTPDEGAEISRGEFVLPDDNLSGTNVKLGETLAEDKQAKVLSNFEKMKAERANQDNHFVRQNLENKN